MAKRKFEIMKHVRNLVTVFFLGMGTLTYAQDAEVKTFSVKKGQVLDFLFIKTKPDKKAELQDYFKRAFPVAEKEGYNRLPTLMVAQNPIQGNDHPSALVCGFWSTTDSRSNFYDQIIKTMPDFFEVRRDIWSRFDLAYFEMEEDLTFEVDPNKFNVFTAYWASEDEKAFGRFKKDWKQKATKSGATIITELTDAKSPFGYMFTPEFVTLTQWDNQEAFEKFLDNNLKMDHEAILHVSQLAVR